MHWLHRCKLLRDGGILDPCAHLVAPERIGGIVGLLVAQYVLVRAEPREEAASVPQILVRRQPFLVGNIERVLRNEIIVEPGEGLGALEEALGKSLLHPPVGLVVELPLPHWQRQVRRALEHGELSDVLVNLLDNLHPVAPVPMTPTRLPLKSTPSCGHRAVWWQMPRKSFSPPIGGIYGFAASPVQSTKNFARVTLPSLACTTHWSRSVSNSAPVTRVLNRMSRLRPSFLSTWRK